ncbi:T9SS type A sorting domain-containing protein [Aquimarina agarilytica]|uniref:T9SS type A sorting domain-containing protein n=1 Tax=Aquimarina agarilytica TaxID=1087449 RepID=UPI0002884D2D|nr:T9SS type A sorting domain-containing protein [Aquimarina agarilytica]
MKTKINNLKLSALALLFTGSLAMNAQTSQCDSVTFDASNSAKSDCNGTNGRIRIDISSNNGPHSLKLYNAKTGDLLGSAASVPNAFAFAANSGRYNIEITSNDGCAITKPVTVRTSFINISGRCNNGELSVNYGFASNSFAPGGIALAREKEDGSIDVLNQVQLSGASQASNVIEEGVEYFIAARRGNCFVQREYFTFAEGACGTNTVVENEEETGAKFLTESVNLIELDIISQETTILYPNPASVELFLENVTPLSSAAILDINGAKVMDLKADENGKIEANIQSLSTGLYIVKTDKKAIKLSVK